ncbi:regulation of apoptotic process [Homalodisca vitripennis]|nr:regulation of apoptotic process [Homalodisca vitripennis]
MKDLKKSSYSQDTRKIRKILNEEARLGISADSDSENEEVDLSKELHPLSHYLNNREEMIEQMFSIIKGAKLKKMLPPILKTQPTIGSER